MAVVPFVVVQYDVGDWSERRYSRKQIVPDPNVRAYQIPFFRKQWSRFVEHAVAHSNLPDVVQQRSEANDIALTIG
jgi:hypothetical protein